MVTTQYGYSSTFVYNSKTLSWYGYSSVFITCRMAMTGCYKELGNKIWVLRRQPPLGTQGPRPLSLSLSLQPAWLLFDELPARGIRFPLTSC